MQETRPDRCGDDAVRRTDSRCGPASEVSVAKDLTAVIALQGMPCGEVVSAGTGRKRLRRGMQRRQPYRVFQNAEGRVVVEKK